MEKSGKILVTGGSGLIGLSLIPELKRQSFNVSAPTHGQCNLEDRTSTLKLFEECKPDYVFHLAAKTGGILANSSDPAGFLYANSLISGHVLEACRKFNVQKVVQPISSCVYPRLCPQPMREEHLLTGPLEPTNEGFALAKISALRLAKYYYDQYGLKVVSPVASGVYGPGDSFDLERCHVLSALVKRFSDAKRENKQTVKLWGTGTPRRQFTYVKDMVKALMFFMNQVQTPEHINVGPESDISIRELAELVSKVTGFSGAVEWDSTKPDGMPKKALDVSKAKQLGLTFTSDLKSGIAEVVADYHARTNFN